MKNENHLFNIGNVVIFHNEKVRIVEKKWGCYKISFLDNSRKALWVDPKDLIIDKIK